MYSNGNRASKNKRKDIHEDTPKSAAKKDDRRCRKINRVTKEEGENYLRSHNYLLDGEGEGTMAPS